MTEKSKTGIKSDKPGTEEDLEQLFGTPLSDTYPESNGTGNAGDAAHGGGSGSFAQNAPEAPAQIESFESLEDFVSSAPEQTEQPQSNETPPAEFSAGTTEGENFPSFTNAGTNAGTNPNIDLGMDFSAGAASTGDNAENIITTDSNLIPDAGFEANSSPNAFADPVPDPPFNSDLGDASDLGAAPEAGSSISIPAPPPAEVSKPATLDSIKNYSESVTTNQTVVAASFPFTLKIDGHLTPQEAEKLIDVMNRENMGFREVDLEPQLAEGKILIPRISEYAGIVLIQALRGVQAKMTFAASELFEGDSEVSSEVRPESVFTKSEAPTHIAGESAESLPVTQGEELPQLGVYEVSDTLIVSGILSTRSLESSSSPEYTALLEALMRELKFKAYRRKARGITMLKIQVAPLTLPTDHRITISGTLVV